MITTTPAYKASITPQRQPNYVIEFSGFRIRVSTHPVFIPTSPTPTISIDIMDLPQTTNPSQVYPDRGQSSVGSVQFDVEDVQGIMTTLLSASPPVTYGVPATLKMGNQYLDYKDYATVFVGIVTGCVIGAAAGGKALTSYTMTISDPSMLTNRQIFNPATTTLAKAMADSDTDMDVWDTTDFLTLGSPAVARYVIIDEEIIQYTSMVTDGFLPKTQADIYDVAFGTGIWVAVGAQGNIFMSTDGINWEQSGSQTSFNLWSVCYGNGMFVCCGDNGTIMTSVDGNEWVVQSGVGSQSNVGSPSLRGVCWASGTINKFVIVANNFVQTSPDGVVWTQRTPPNTNAWQCVAYSPSLDLLCAGSATDRNMMTSPDGIAWSLRSGGTQIPGQALTQINAITWVSGGGGFFIAVSTEANYQTSTNGITWNIVDTAISNFFVDANDVAYDPVLNLIVVVGPPDGVVGANTLAYISPAGVSWTNVSGTGFWHGVASNGTGRFVRVSTTNGGTYLQLASTSTTGHTFTIFKHQFIGLTRGVLRTAAAAHDPGKGVEEMLRLGPARPMDILLSILLSTTKTGCGMSSDLVDIAGINALTFLINLSCQMDFRINKSWNAKDFIEQQILQPLALFPATSNGLYSVKQILLGSSLLSLSHDNILEGSANEGEPAIGLDTNWSASIINQVEIQSDYDIVKDKFYTRKTYKSQSSINEFGVQTVPTIQSYGIRSELGSPPIKSAMDRLFSVFGKGASIIFAEAFMATNIIELGDTADVTSSLLPNFETGVRGLFNALVLVINRAIMFEQGKVALQVLQPHGSNGNDGQPVVIPCVPTIADLDPGIKHGSSPPAGLASFTDCIYQDADRVYTGVEQATPPAGSPPTRTYQQACIYVVKKIFPDTVEQVIGCGPNADEIRWITSDATYIYALVDDPFTGSNTLALKRILRSDPSQVISLTITTGSTSFYRNSQSVINGSFLYVAYSDNSTSDGKLIIKKINLSTFTVDFTLTLNPLSATGTLVSYGLAVDPAAGMIYATCTKSDSTEKFDVIVYFINLNTFVEISHLNKTEEASPSTSMASGSCSAPVFNSNFVYVGYHVAGPSADQGVIRIDKPTRAVVQDVRPGVTLPGQEWYGMACDEDYLYSIGSDKRIYRQVFNDLSVIQEGQVLQSDASKTPVFLLVQGQLA